MDKVTALIRNIVKHLHEHIEIYRKNMWTYDETTKALIHSNEPIIDELLYEAFKGGFCKALDSNLMFELGYDEQKAFELWKKEK